MLLQSGSLRILYQNGFLRQLSCGGEEILRMIYFAYRDENWGTLPLRIEHEQIDAKEKSFKISYDGFHEVNGTPVCAWKVSIAGDENGAIEFIIRGTSLQHKKKNRVGFCVLHPPQSATLPCELLHDDGSKEMSQFPGPIAPDDPFKHLSGIRWPAAGTWFKLKFEGDSFETEDQRNWTDASFKTFCTSLSKPFPVLLKEGEVIIQKVILTAEGIPRRDESTTDTIILKESDEFVSLPRMGIGASTEIIELSEKMAGLLKALALDHYRVDVIPGDASWEPSFSQECKNANKLGLPLAIALHLSENFKTEIDSVKSFLNGQTTKVTKWMVFSEGKKTTSQSIIDYAAILKTNGVLVGAGTNYNFTELNRNRFDASPLDFVLFSVNPQEHAIDNLTIMENREGQNAVVRSATIMYPGKDIVVSPITLKRRFNPYSTNVQERVRSSNERADSRQETDFAAAFTLGCIIQHALAGTAALTLYQTAGRQGLITANGEPNPIYNLLKTLATNISPVKPLGCSHPMLCGGIALDDGGSLIVNFSETAQTIHFEERQFVLAPYQIIETK